MTNIADSTRVRKRTLDDLEKSRTHLARAEKVIPLGVSSSKRATQRPVPIVLDHAKGSRVYDIDGNEYIDYLAGWGPMILGHQHEAVLAAVRDQLTRGAHFATALESEAELAERIVRLVPSAEMVTFVSTGSEAVHLALTIARGATGRERVLKFDGHFNGWIAPMATNMSGTPPVDDEPPYALNPEPGRVVGDDVVICPWNDIAAFEAVIAEVGDSLAAVIMEAVVTNAGALAPLPGYLERVREICDAHGIVLIFDEVVTGFRLALGGAQEKYGVTPDLSTFAKAMGNGFQIAAVAGRRKVMEAASIGPVRTYGTYNANPLALAAANATLAELENGGEDSYAALDRIAQRLADGIQASARAHGLPLTVNRAGSILALLWGLDREPVTYRDAAVSDRDELSRLDEQLTLRGVLTSDARKLFVSFAHTDADIDETLEVFDEALREIA